MLGLVRQKTPIRRSLSDEALADCEAAVDWYLEALAFTAAEDVVSEVEQTIRLLESLPNAGIEAPHKTRVLTLSKFPCWLVYRTDPDRIRIRIITVAHQRRKLRFWRGTM